MYFKTTWSITCLHRPILKQWKHLVSMCLSFHFCWMCCLLQHGCDIVWVRNGKKENSDEKFSTSKSRELVTKKKQKKIVSHMFSRLCLRARKYSVAIPGRSSRVLFFRTFHIVSPNLKVQSATQKSLKL